MFYRVTGAVHRQETHCGGHFDRSLPCFPAIAALADGFQISKQEWMKFMEAEFDRFDTQKTGEIDQKEVGESELVASQMTRAFVLRTL